MFSVPPDQLQRQQRAGHRQRHAQNDHERRDEALELRSQHEVDEREREQERHVDLRRRILELARDAVVVDLRASGPITSRVVVSSTSSASPSVCPAPIDAVIARRAVC